MLLQTIVYVVIIANASKPFLLIVILSFCLHYVGSLYADTYLIHILMCTLMLNNDFSANIWTTDTFSPAQT